MATCWACGSESQPAHEYAPAPLYRCPGCGLLFEPESPHDEVRGLYDDAYFDEYLESLDYANDANRRYEGRRRARWVRRQRPPGGRLLEIGAAQGHFMAAARRLGFTPVGIEPADETARATAARLDLPVHSGFVEDVELSPSSFDVVCAWHVLEHIPQPAPVLKRLRAALAPGGLVCLEVPNVASVEAQRRLRDWSFLDLRHHVAHYGPKALAALLEGCDFEVAHCASFPASAYFGLDKALDPRTLVFYARQARDLRTLPRRTHPWKHDLLRAVARRPR